MVANQNVFVRLMTDHSGRWYADLFMIFTIRDATLRCLYISIRRLLIYFLVWATTRVRPYDQNSIPQMSFPNNY